VPRHSDSPEFLHEKSELIIGPQRLVQDHTRIYGSSVDHIIIVL